MKDYLKLLPNLVLTPVKKKKEGKKNLDAVESVTKYNGQLFHTSVLK